MPLTRPSLQDLITRVENDLTSRLTSGVSLLQKAVLFVLARVFAGGWHLIYGYLQNLSLQLFPDKADSDFLDRQALMWGVPRNPATFGSGQVEFTGVDTTVIPSGTLLVSDAGLQYITQSTVSISGADVGVVIQAQNAGSAYNAPFNAKFSLVSPIVGIDSTVTVFDAVVGGADTESDDSLKKRIINRIQNPPMGGNANDYFAWALATASVLNAYIIANYYGLGTVAVVITEVGGPVASGQLITDVQAYIDARRPVTAQVTVSTITTKAIDLTIGLNPNTTVEHTLVQTSLQAMLDSDASPGGTILLSHLYDAIGAAGGVNNFNIQTIVVGGVGHGVSDIVLTGFDFPVLGTLTFTTL